MLADCRARALLNVKARCRVFHFNKSVITPPDAHNMADFFNLKARQAAAAQGSSSKAPTAKQESNRMQPWVEK